MIKVKIEVLNPKNNNQAQRCCLCDKPIEDKHERGMYLKIIFGQYRKDFCVECCVMGLTTCISETKVLLELLEKALPAATFINETD